jgi:hypothetical protein
VTFFPLGELPRPPGKGGEEVLVLATIIFFLRDVALPAGVVQCETILKRRLRGPYLILNDRGYACQRRLFVPGPRASFPNQSLTWLSILGAPGDGFAFR